MNSNEATNTILELFDEKYGIDEHIILQGMRSIATTKTTKSIIDDLLTNDFECESTGYMVTNIYHKVYTAHQVRALAILVGHYNDAYKFKVVVRRDSGYKHAKKSVFYIAAKSVRAAKQKVTKEVGYTGVSDYVNLCASNGERIDTNNYCEWMHGNNHYPEVVQQDEPAESTDDTVRPQQELLTEITQTDDAAKANEPRVLTHSYFHSTGAKVNPLSTYISELKLVKQGNIPDGFVFCMWVCIHSDVQLVVKPSQEVLERSKVIMGYPIVAIQPRETVDGVIRLTASYRTDSTGFYHTAVLGDLDETSADTLINSADLIHWQEGITE